MGEDVLSVIPADPHWQPDRDRARRAVGLAERLTSARVEVSWYDEVAVVDCGENLERIGCPLCQASIAVQWWVDLLETRCVNEITGLDVETPCCGGRTTLDALHFDQPCGFARFEIAVWNSEQEWFGADELAAFAELLGHPVRQIRAHL